MSGFLNLCDHLYDFLVIHPLPVPDDPLKLFWSLPYAVCMAQQIRAIFMSFFPGRNLPPQIDDFLLQLVIVGKQLLDMPTKIGNQIVEFRCRSAVVVSIHDFACPRIVVTDSNILPQQKSPWRV